MANCIRASVPVNHDNMTVSQHVQYQDHETEADKWNSAIIHFLFYACAFPVKKACSKCIRHSPGFIFIKQLKVKYWTIYQFQT